MFEFFRRTWRPQALKKVSQITWAQNLAPQVRNLRAFSERKLGGHSDLVLKTVTTVTTLAVIYYAVTTLVAWITAPRIEMTMSPVAGPIAVVAEPAKKGEIVEKVTYTGSVSPYQEVTVFPRVEGWVEKFSLYEGDYVKAGQVIARLDRAELTASVDRQKAALEAARGELANAKAALLEAQASTEYWEKELPRFVTLVKAKAIPASDYDNALRQAEATKAKVEAQRANIKAVEAKIESLKAEVERTRTVVGYTDISAPISGRVTKRHIYAGILVKPGMPIVDLQDLSRVRVQAKVAEADLAKVRVGTEAVIGFHTLPNPHNEFKAQVSTIFPQLDPATRTATVEVVLPNPGGMIKSDMYAVMDLRLEKKNQAVLIPRLAVLEGPEKKPVVYVTDGVTAMSRSVKLGIAEGDRIEVLEGVKEGEMVVWRGQRSLSDGAQVNVIPEL